MALLTLLEHRRAVTEAELGRLIVDGSNANICKCGYGVAQREGFASLLDEGDILEQTAEKIISFIRRIPYKTVQKDKIICARGNMHEPMMFPDTINGQLASSMKRAAGLY